MQYNIIQYSVPNAPYKSGDCLSSRLALIGYWNKNMFVATFNYGTSFLRS